MPLYALVLITPPEEATFQTLVAVLRIAERKKRACAALLLKLYLIRRL